MVPIDPNFSVFWYRPHWRKVIIHKRICSRLVLLNPKEFLKFLNLEYQVVLLIVLIKDFLFYIFPCQLFSNAFFCINQVPAPFLIKFKFQYYKFPNIIQKIKSSFFILRILLNAYISKLVIKFNKLSLIMNILFSIEEL